MSTVPRFGFLDMLQAQAQAYQAGVEDGKAASGVSEMLALLVDLIDSEGPQPGTADWADRVRVVVNKHQPNTTKP